MQEEKKTERPEGGKKNKHRPPRRHGYFIEPPTEKKQGEQTPAPSKPTDNREAAQGAPASGNGNGARKPQQGHGEGNSHHSKKHKNKPKAQQNESQAQPKTAEAAPTQQNKPETAQGAQGQSPKKSNRSRNRSKHKSHNAQTAPQNGAEKSASSPSTQPKQKPQERSSQTTGRGKGHQPRADMSAHAAHSADDYEEYKLIVPEDEPNAKGKKASESVPKTEVVGIRFKSTGKIYYFDPKGLKLPKGSKAIVDTARGQEFGEVAMTNGSVSTSDIVPPLRPVIRAATPADIEHNNANKQKEEEAFRVCSEKIKDHKLDMKLIEAQYTFDNSKLLFYFTSSDRVDFRDLVKDLASVFHTRIELRQIGIRDEAKLMGGLGMCGRPLCCTLFLSDFDQVSIKMAKEQNLSLNSAKISGICGRLMCCLKYEHEAYEYEIKRTPPVDSLVRTENGDGIVTEISPLAGTIKVRLLASPEVPPKVYKRDEVTMLRKKNTENK